MISRIQIYEIISINFKPMKLVDFIKKMILVIKSNIMKIIDNMQIETIFRNSVYETKTKTGKKYIDTKVFISIFIIAIFLNFKYLFRVNPTSKIVTYFIMKKKNIISIRLKKSLML